MMRLIERLEEGLIALLLTVMTLITFGQVVARYVFNYSFVWALELNTFLFRITSYNVCYTKLLR